MRSKFASSREFVRGAARYHDLVYVLSRGIRLVEQEIAHTSAICVDQGDWADAVNTDWDSTAIAVAKKPTEKLVFVGEDGDVSTYVGGNSTTEKIDPDPIIIRNARTINGYVYACGMRRQVYKRVDEGKWIDISAPFSEPEEKAGFEAIDGYSEEEIYAVGWNGEIWEYDGSNWHDRTGPTNVILTAVCCAPDGFVYAAGRNGIIVKGRHETWEVIEWDDITNVDLWDLCWFNDKLYVASIDNLFTLQGSELVDVDFGDVDLTSCYSLTACDGVMWSIGQVDVLSFDGKAWQRYD